MADKGEATPDGSLETASSAIQGLLSVKAEDKTPVKTQPEPVSAVEPKQAPTAPEPEEPSAPESEQAEPEADETPEVAPPEPRRIKVKLPDGEQELPEDEVANGYLRTADYTRKAQALAAEKRQFEEGVVRVARERDAQYAAHLEQLSAAVKATIPVEPDWEKLRTEVTPDVLAARLLEWQGRQKQLATLQTEQDAVAARQAEDADRGFRQHVEQEQAKLEDALPEMKDPVKGKALKTALGEFAIARGFTAKELDGVTDHRVVLLLRDAMQFSAAKANAPKVENKIAKAMETSAPGARTNAPKANALKEATQRLKKSGSLDDGAAAIALLI